MPMTKSNRHLQWVIYVLATIVALISAPLILWLTNPTELYYRHVSTSIEQNEDGAWLAYITRELPRGTVKGRWKLEVWVRRGEMSTVCTKPWSGIVEYQQENGPTVSYELPDRVQRCMNAAPPISLIWTRQIFLFGWLPLAPAVTNVEIAPVVTPAERDG